MEFGEELSAHWNFLAYVASLISGFSFVPLGAVDARKIPSFLGIEITNLFIFFCVFIGLSGVAAAILFGMYKWLEKRMHCVK